MPGQQAPDFSLKNTSGGTVRLSEYQKGGPLLLAFFKHECPTCQLGMPFVERIYRRSRGGPVRFLGIAQDGKQEAAAFAKEYALMMPFVLEEAPWPSAEAYGLTNLPTLFLLDGERRVLLGHAGFSRKAYQELADRVAALCGKEGEPLFDTLSSVPEAKPG